MTNRTAFVRGIERGSWRKAPTTGGVCFTISWDRFEDILKTGSIPEAFPNWHLKDDEFVERYEINADGVTVFIGRNNG